MVFEHFIGTVIILFVYHMIVVSKLADIEKQIKKIGK